MAGKLLLIMCVLTLLGCSHCPPTPLVKPGISVSTSGIDGAGAYPISAAGELAADCAETTLKLNWLQNWAEKGSRANE